MIIRDNVSDQVFKTWFEKMRPVKWDGSTLTLELPSHFFFEWIEQHYASLLNKTVQKILGPKAKLQFEVVVDENATTPSQRTVKLPALRGASQPALPFADGKPQPVPQAQRTTQVTHYPTFFNPRYTFDNFIRGENNQLATSAGIAVADNPGKTKFNPLVIYGPTGLGKTHLVQAIGNRVLQRNPNARVLYTNSEKFTMEYINAIQTNKVPEFTNFYRGVDVLIVDDIQFLVPLALVGSVAALAIAGLDLSIAAMVGFITLAGITARNGILKVSHTLNLVLREGQAFDRATIRRACLERMTPVLMTAVSAGIALLPLMIGGDQPGKEILHPVAVTIFGGLITATLLDAVVTPVLIERFGAAAIARLRDEDQEAGRPAEAY